MVDSFECVKMHGPTNPKSVMCALYLLLVSFVSVDAAMFEAEKTPFPRAVSLCNVLLPILYEK